MRIQKYKKDLLNYNYMQGEVEEMDILPPAA